MVRRNPSALVKHLLREWGHGPTLEFMKEWPSQKCEPLESRELTPFHPNTKTAFCPAREEAGRGEAERALVGGLGSDSKLSRYQAG